METKKTLSLLAGLGVLVVAAYIGFGGANQQNTALAASPADTEVKLEDEKAKLGYMYGSQIATDMVRAGVVSEIDIEAFLAAQRDAFAGREPRMSLEEMQAVQQSYMAKQQAAAAVLAAQNKAKGEA
ncbi:MAG: FKBP-type peptidyl-prolyl cis-trans isomerase N-terminal domain-containing protein, partial [Arenicella sp.]|nr:FKBP-type peptidyl-prolyl cis-trans isomerase N-terminal domain-containing protein [Arenicella sp.]